MSDKKLMCGAARRDITPGEDILRGVRGLPGMKYSGVHDPLSCRVIAFSNGTDRAAIIQLDLDKDQAPEKLLALAGERWGIPEENILYFGIHTHSAAVFSGRRELTVDDDTVLDCTHKFEERVFNAIFEAGDEAFANLKEAKIGCAVTQCYTNVRRVQNFDVFDDEGKLSNTMSTQGSDPAADISHDLFVMRVNDMEDKPIVFLINYPMHCVIMYLNYLGEDGRSLISSDVGGNLSRMVEKRFPGAVAAWSSGAAGDINPLPNSFNNFIDPETGELKEFKLDDPDKVLEYLVGTQFMDTMRAINSIDSYSSCADIGGKVEWSRTPVHKNERVGREFVVHEEIIEDGFAVRVQLLKLGEIAFAGIGGELYNSFGQAIKQRSPFKHTVVINHNCSLISNVGYIIDDDALNRDFKLHKFMKNSIVPGYIGPSLTTIFDRLAGELK